MNKELTDEELLEVTGGNVLTGFTDESSTKQGIKVNPEYCCDKYENAAGKVKNYKCRTCKYYNGHYVCTNKNIGSITKTI